MDAIVGLRITDVEGVVLDLPRRSRHGGVPAAKFPAVLENRARTRDHAIFPGIVARHHHAVLDRRIHAELDPLRLRDEAAINEELLAASDLETVGGQGSSTRREGEHREQELGAFHEKEKIGPPRPLTIRSVAHRALTGGRRLPPALDL